jgi:hypothetical protein
VENPFELMTESEGEESSSGGSFQKEAGPTPMDVSYINPPSQGPGLFRTVTRGQHTRRRLNKKGKAQDLRMSYGSCCTALPLPVPSQFEIPRLPSGQLVPIKETIHLDDSVSQVSSMIVCPIPDHLE